MTGEIISFYSYKGGVGRSMALANLAVLLAQRGHRVLAVDFDLEAPGLHRYFLHPSRRSPSTTGQRAAPNPEPPAAMPPPVQPANGQRGVIDLFVELRARAGEEARAPTGVDIVGSLLDSGRYGYDVWVGDPGKREGATIRLLTAGRFDDDYPERVRDLVWPSFHEEHGDLFTDLTAEWRRRYDYILVDSRTGISDIGSVSTVLLADKLVIAFSPNEQSLRGAIEIGRQAVALKREIGPDLPLFPLLSRVDEGETELRRSWARLAADSFGGLFDELYGRRDVDFGAYFEAVRVPHSSYYAYGERIAAEDETPGNLGSPVAAYARFLDCLSGPRLAGWEDRVSDPLHARPHARALVASFDGEIDIPRHLGVGRVVRIPEPSSPEASARLRRVPVDATAWADALAAIDRGVAAVLATGGDELHVFAAMPYPAAVYLGRRLDDLGRARPLHLHQLDPETHAWEPFSIPSAAEATEFYRELEVVTCSASGPILLAIEGMRPIADDALHTLATRLGAQAFYRLRPRGTGPLRSLAEARGAVHGVRQALFRAQPAAGASALHVVTTAPLALLVELGRLVTPNVYGSVIVHQFDPRSAAYVPVLDVISRRVPGVA